ncbi:MAG: lytic transglycosylase domain-containing protein [Verrucomicrobiae bacterium]|nr:lytic transglycosylase domain-containing protein [Verrucomicrobiae bacterium]
MKPVSLILAVVVSACSDAQLTFDLELDEVELLRLCRKLQEQFQSEYVLDLAALRQVATALLPLLEQFEETEPLAAWLKTRLDYLEMAEQLKPATPPPQPPPNPAPETLRRAWQQRTAKLPPSPHAKLATRLKPFFTAESVPAELVWIAEVESSFNPRARSPVGAVGLFQLMPTTATMMGLRLQPQDERTDPDKNAQAAAKYLRYLFARFNDWRLTLAAYNAGETRVRNLLSRHKASTFDAIATRLPAETQLYVPRVEAVIQKREGVPLVKLPAPKAK